MAELTAKERLQPSLLDRLTDDEPDKTAESRDKRVLSPNRLRECVRRDLSWLFNATNLACVEDLEPYPEIEQSGLNYGLPDLAGKTASSVDLDLLERLLRRAIWQFEPRLIRNTVKVKLAGKRDDIEHNALTFNIEAEMWAQPLPLRLYLRTRLDLETGDARITEIVGADAE
jgi:type VI secretion system protein ImpF